jgi:hypothetical protein
MAVTMASGSSRAGIDNYVFVNPLIGANAGNTTCGQANPGTNTGPCADVNTALQNLPPTGGTVIIEEGGTFGPIVIGGSGPVTIVGRKFEVVTFNFRPNTQPGCVGGAPGSCNGGANATYAVVLVPDPA